MKLLENKTALITGAARGIGRSIVLAYAAEGANVAFTDLNIDENAESLLEELKAFGVKAKAYASDASSFEGSEALVQEVLKDFGKVDILVNNAGITRDQLLLRMTEQDWDLVIKVNLKVLKIVTNTMDVEVKVMEIHSFLEVGAIYTSTNPPLILRSKALW